MNRRAQLGPFLLGALLTGGVVLLLLLLTHHGSAHHASVPPAPSEAPANPAPASGAPAHPAPAGQQLGLNVNWLFNAGLYSAAEVSAQLGAVRATGVTVARTDALWEASEPAAPAGSAHRWDWRFDDRVAQALASHKLRWMPILDYTARWAQSVPGKEHSPPRQAADFAAFAGTFAARYGRSGTFWREHPGLAAFAPDTFEVWNEPDNRAFWEPTPDAAAYANLYLAARNAVDAVDPSARVLIGGLSHSAGFLRALLRARPDLAGHVDGVAIHPYGATPLAVDGRVHDARTTLDELGLRTVPLYVTEVGWTTSPPGALDYAPAQRRPNYVAATVQTLGRSDCGLAATVLYTWVTPQHNPDDHEQWFGIASPTGAATPASVAFTDAVRAVLGHAAPAARLCAS